MCLWQPGARLAGRNAARYLTLHRHFVPVCHFERSEKSCQNVGKRSRFLASLRNDKSKRMRKCRCRVNACPFAGVFRPIQGNRSCKNKSLNFTAQVLCHGLHSSDCENKPNSGWAAPDFSCPPPAETLRSILFVRDSCTRLARRPGRTLL
jgi:hypothetical protein